MKAVTEAGAPLPPANLSSPITRVAPVEGSCSRLVRFSSTIRDSAQGQPADQKLPVGPGLHASGIRGQPGGLPLFQQHAGRVDAETGKVKAPIGSAPQVGGRILPAPAPTGTQDYQASGRDRAVFSFPSGEVSQRKAIVGVVFAMGSDVYDGGGDHQTLDRVRGGVRPSGEEAGRSGKMGA